VAANSKTQMVLSYVISIIYAGPKYNGKQPPVTSCSSPAFIEVHSSDKFRQSINYCATDRRTDTWQQHIDYTVVKFYHTLYKWLDEWYRHQWQMALISKVKFTVWNLADSHTLQNAACGVRYVYILHTNDNHETHVTSRAPTGIFPWKVSN